MERLLKNEDNDGAKLIYAAIDTYDMAKVVRAAMISLNKVNWTDQCNAKSKTVSTESRILGNEHYKAGRIRQAVQFYNRALAFAPKFSEEMMFAYGNRSAVFFNIRYFTACVSDINTCLSMGCSEALANKLRKRREDASPFMLEEGMFQMMTSSVFVNTFFRFDCKRNPDVPCTSADVVFVTRNSAKRATARGDIGPGTLVAFERAFASCPADNNSIFITCYYCNRAELRLQPCEGCCRALFCKNECRDLCMKEYHRIECQIVNNIMYCNNRSVLITRTAIKLSLKMTWDEFITASKDIGASRMTTATVKQAFNSEEPLSILSYDDKVEKFLEGKMFNGSISCASIILSLFRVPGYFPKEPKKCEAAMEAMARVMLQLYVTFTNQISIQSTAYDFKSKSYTGVIQTHCGWFSMSSKLKHSCQPNLMVVGLNDSVALVALRTIKSGEELTISYSLPFYDIIIESADPFARATHVFIQTRRICECRVCVQNWDSNSAITVKMTNKQSKLFAKVNEKNKNLDYECFKSICAALDAFPINSLQHQLVVRTLREMLHILQSKHFDNVTYL